MKQNIKNNLLLERRSFYLAESINKVTSKMLIKRTLKASLPKRLPIGELCYCTDVNELYIGDDEGNILHIGESLSRRFDVNNR